MTGGSRLPGLTSASRPHLLTALAAALGAASALDLPAPLKLALLAAATLAVVVGGPVASVSLVCLALPLSMTTIAIGRSDWSPLELALLACWVSTACALLGRLTGARKWRGTFDALGPLDLILLAIAFAVVGALSLLWVADVAVRSDSLREYRRVILEPLILVPAVGLIRERANVRVIVPWLVLPAVAVATLALGQLVLQTSVVEIGRIARPIGTFTHPNNLAFYLERAVWFAPLLVMTRFQLPRAMPWGAAAIIAGGAVLTLSRGALVALAVGGTVLFWELVRPNWRHYLIVISGAGGAIALSRAAFGGGDSTENRATIWRASIEMIRDHPLRGVGLDQFLGQYGRRNVEPAGWDERYTSHPHNIALDFWLRLGLPGIVLLWAMSELTWARLKLALAAPPRSIRRAAVAMLLAGFAHGLIDNSFFLADLACLTWLGLALASQGGVSGAVE